MERQTLKWHRLTNRQIDAAKRFERKYGVTVSQAGKYLEWFIALEQGRIPREQLQKETGLLLKSEE